MVIKYNIQDHVRVMFHMFRVSSSSLLFLSSFFFSSFLYSYLHVDASFTVPPLYNVRFKDAGASSSHKRRPPTSRHIALISLSLSPSLSIPFSHLLISHQFTFIIAYKLYHIGFRSRVVIAIRIRMVIK